jgi:hypothetical protein
MQPRRRRRRRPFFRKPSWGGGLEGFLHLTFALQNEKMAGQFTPNKKLMQSETRRTLQQLICAPNTSGLDFLGRCVIRLRRMQEIVRAQ